MQQQPHPYPRQLRWFSTNFCCFAITHDLVPSIAMLTLRHFLFVFALLLLTAWVSNAQVDGADDVGRRSGKRTEREQDQQGGEGPPRRHRRTKKASGQDTADVPATAAQAQGLGEASAQAPAQERAGLGDVVGTSNSLHFRAPMRDASTQVDAEPMDERHYHKFVTLRDLSQREAVVQKEVVKRDYMNRVATAFWAANQDKLAPRLEGEKDNELHEHHFHSNREMYEGPLSDVQGKLRRCALPALKALQRISSETHADRTTCSNRGELLRKTQPHRDKIDRCTNDAIKEAIHKGRRSHGQHESGHAEEPLAESMVDRKDINLKIIQPMYFRKSM